MKKLFHTLLFSLFLFPTFTTQPKELTPGAVTKNLLKGTLQIIKIAGGAIIMAGGIVLFTLPCSCAWCAECFRCCLKMIPDAMWHSVAQDTNDLVNSLIPGTPIKPQSVKEAKKSVKTSLKCCRCCCAGTGLVLGVPTTYGGYRLAKSGVMEFAKMVDDTSKKEVSVY